MMIYNMFIAACCFVTRLLTTQLRSDRRAILMVVVLVVIFSVLRLCVKIVDLLFFILLKFFKIGISLLMSQLLLWESSLEEATFLILIGADVNLIVVRVRIRVEVLNSLPAIELLVWQIIFIIKRFLLHYEPHLLASIILLLAQLLHFFTPC